MLRQLFCSLILLGVPAAAHTQASAPSPHAIDIPKWFTESFLDMREDVADAAKQGKRVMIYFGQDGCPYCKALMKVNFGDPAIVALTRRDFVAIALNIWGDREVTWIDGRVMSEKALAAMLRVQYTPTLLFFDEQATVVLRLNGYQTPDKFRPALDYVGSKREKRQPYTEYLAGLPPEKARATLSTQAFFAKGEPDLPRLLASGKPAVALFERRFCSDCDALHNEGFANAEVRKLLAGVSVVQLDIAGKRRVITPERASKPEGEWARDLTVVYSPTLVFFDASGKEVFRAEGHLKPFHLASALEYVGSGAYKGEPSFQRYIQKRADAMRARGQAVDLWQ